jgi:hypothetical protein
VIDAGGVAFVGVVDAVLFRACAQLDRPEDAARWSASAAAAYRRIGATWLAGALGPPAGAQADVAHGQARGHPGAAGALAERAVAHPRPTSGPPGAPAEPRVLHLRPGGDGIWWVGRDGGPSAVRDVRGLHYLHLLLARPGLDVPALALSDAVAGNLDARAVDGGAGPLLDRQAIAAYRSRLGELDDELAEARVHADLAREQRLDREREALLDQLRAATGLGGRARVAVGTHERARVAVRKAIAAAIDRITAVDPSLGRLLIDTISTGATCRYDPDPDRPMRWIL